MSIHKEIKLSIINYQVFAYREKLTMCYNRQKLKNPSSPMNFGNTYHHDIPSDKL